MKTMEPWNDAKIVKAEPGHKVIAWTGMEVWLGTFNEDGELLTWPNGYAPTQFCTHWMDIPNPPEEN